MRRESLRLIAGFVAVLLVTLALAAAVATSGAVSHELADGDRCETGGDADVPKTVTAENVSSLAGNVTSCVAEGAAGDDPPTAGE